MSINVISKPFSDVRSRIATLGDQIYHTVELLNNQPSPIDTLEDNGKIVGFADTRIVKGQELIDYTNENYLDDEAPPTSFYNDVDPNIDYVWINILDVIESHQQKGYGRDYVNLIKARYPEHRIYVYAITTVEFWYKQQFKKIGDDTEWVRYN